MVNHKILKIENMSLPLAFILAFTILPFIRLLIFFSSDCMYQGFDILANLWHSPKNAAQLKRRHKIIDGPRQTEIWGP